jgi:hypothetical protein
MILETLVVRSREFTIYRFPDELCVILELEMPFRPRRFNSRRKACHAQPL